MSADQGRRGASGKGGDRSGRGPAAARRLALLIFGVGFILLFAILAIAEGIGDPSVPSGDAALVEDVPGDIGDVSEAEVTHAIELAAAQEGEKTPPQPGDPKYEERLKTGMQSVLEVIWIQGIADERDIEVTDAEVANALKKAKKQSFKSEAEFQEFLKESGYTPADIDTRLRTQVITNQVQEQLMEEAPTPTQDEVEDYYEAAKSTQFTQPATRDVRLIVNKDQKKADEALDALSGDNSEANWKKVAKEFSEDPATKASGGLRKGVTEGTLEGSLDGAVFAASEGVIEGPIKAPQGYTVFEVVSSKPESVQDLKSVEGQIQSTLTQEMQQESFANFGLAFTEEWRQRTFCAPGYVVEICANFESTGRPPTAPEACYEANPKGGRPEACPAPVTQLVPAMPGTVTRLAPKGEPLAQRPRPLGEPEASPEEGITLPEGALPPPSGSPPAE